MKRLGIITAIAALAISLGGCGIAKKAEKPASAPQAQQGKTIEQNFSVKERLDMIEKRVTDIEARNSRVDARARKHEARRAPVAQ